MLCCLLYYVRGARNQIISIKNDATTVTEIVTEITTEQLTTEEDDHSSGIFPPSVYDYDVTDTILVPENER